MDLVVNQEVTQNVQEVANPAADSTAKSKEKTKADLDIDFENYSVDAPRKEAVRSFVEALKNEAWVNDLKALVSELGQKEADDDAEPALPGMLKETAAQVFAVSGEHPAAGFEITLSGTEMKVYLNKKALVELSFLPKGNEFAVFYVDEASFDVFKTKMNELTDLLKEARSKKSARQTLWKARFE